MGLINSVTSKGEISVKDESIGSASGTLIIPKEGYVKVGYNKTNQVNSEICRLEGPKTIGNIQTG